MWTVEIAIMLTMIAVNSVFAAYEIALASVSSARLQLLSQENRSGARAALFMKRNMEASLAVVQLGITLVGAVAAATGGAGADENIAPWLRQRWGVSAEAAELLAIASVVLPLTGLTIMFGELVPKVFALRNKEWVCLRLSPFMRGFGVCVWPAVWLFETGVTTIMGSGEPSSGAPGKTESSELQELRATAALARASRLIGAREERIILGAARLSSQPVREIALPAEHITMFAVEDSVADCLVTAHLDMHTRFPVAEVRGDPQTIRGYVNFKDLVASLRLNPHDASSIQAVVRPIPRLHGDGPIANCMEHMIREHSHIALVQEADGKVVGMITMEDVLEELVGDIQDEYDNLPTHALRTGAAWIVGGGIGPERLRQMTGIALAEDFAAAGARNLNEWIVHHRGGPVRGGEVMERQGVRIVVRKVRRQKVLEAQLGQQPT